MAERRMIKTSVVDSDAFLDMPSTAQNLYFHLNVRADDEGFVDSPKGIMRKVGANQNDFEILLAKRYLLSFDSGVIVIKHWKLHNMIRTDRIKPTLYKEEKCVITEKENGVYTDSPPQIDDISPRNAAECPPRVGEGSIGENSREEKTNKKEKSDFEAETPEESALNQIQQVVDHWNGFENLPKCKYQPITLGSIATSDILSKISVFGLPDVLNAITNLSNHYESEERRYRISSLKGLFSGDSFDRWTDDAKPWERYEESGGHVNEIDEKVMDEIFPVGG